MAEKNALPPGRTARWRAGTLTYTTAGLILLFLWLLGGDLAWSLKERSVTSVVQLFLKRFEASDFITGLLIGTLPQALAMVLGPVVAYKSDRHRGRWGRRIPFILIPTPFIVLSMAGLAFTPWIGSHLNAWLGSHSPGLFPSTLIVFAAFWTVFEVTTIVANSVLGALINDVVPTEIIGRFFGMFRAVTLIAGIIFNYSILKHAEAHFTAIFVGIAIIYGVGCVVMCLKVREGSYPPPPPEAEGEGPLGGIVTYFRESFGKPYYLLYIAMNALCWSALIPINLYGIFFMKSLDMSLVDYGKWIAVTYAISLVLSYPLGSLADRFHPLRMSIALMSCYAVLGIAGWLLIHDITTFTIALVAGGVLSGAWMTATASIGQRLLPATRFAQYSSAAGLINALINMIVGPGVGLVLDASGHNYRLTYLASGLIASAAVVVGLLLYRQFHKLGGNSHYTAPD